MNFIHFCRSGMVPGEILGRVCMCYLLKHSGDILFSGGAR